MYDNSWKARWSSGTEIRGDRALFQLDGNLVAYEAAWRALWSSGSEGQGKVFSFQLQPNRNLVIYYDERNRPVWSGMPELREKFILPETETPIH